MNPETLAAYEANVLEATRQVHHSTKKPNDALDLVLSINGIPVATAELKNPFTQQTYENAIRQYRYDRLPTDGPGPCIQARCAGPLCGRSRPGVHDD